MVNIEFTGRFSQNQLSGLYADADLVWAAYPNKDYNVKYAISNKFHESIVYQKPCIYADKTKLGDLVTSKQIGLIVDPYNTSNIYGVLNSVITHRSQLETLAENLGVKDRCYFAGYVKDAYRYMKCYDVYIASSRSEGFPLMLLEAAQYKVPTVCSRIPVFEEIFSTDEVAFFELDNIASLVEAVKSVPNGSKMYERYISCYTPEKFYERYLEIYAN